MASRPRAYTLIEMLMVVAIIALLLWLLVPVLSRAKAQARQAVCASNLRQLGIAMAAYTVQARQWIPGSPNTTVTGRTPPALPANRMPTR